MKLDKLRIKRFKNLIDFEIDFKETSLITVIIGKNGTGKSNLFEAIVSIFGHLYLPSIYKNKPPFNYNLKYTCDKGKTNVEIDASLDRKGAVYTILVNGEKIKFSEFIEKDKNDIFKYLPRYIVAYYSGMSLRLKDLFLKQQEHFLKELLDGKPQPLRPMLYARLMQSHFVLLSFFLYPNKKALQILKNKLGIIGIESVLFVLKTPTWNKSNRVIEDGDKRFWYARGVVQGFLSKLFENSYAPIRYKGSNNKSQNLFLYFPDIESLKKIIKKEKNYQKHTEFFKVLESMDISDLMQEVKTIVKKIDVDGNITYKELSEGEQQFIMVLGLMKFTKDKESLYLLDEPDTHLNPAWKYSYLETLEDIIGKDEKSSQIIMSTHDPLVFFGLERDSVIVFEKELTGKISKIITHHPEKNPNGMSVTAILTSELFGLPTLSPEMTEDMQKRRELFVRKNIEKKRLNENEKQELETLTQKLRGLINESVTDDEIYNQFMEAMTVVNAAQNPLDNLSATEINERKRKAVNILTSLINKKNKKR